MKIIHEQAEEQILMTIPYGQDEIRLVKKEFRGKDYLDLRKYKGTGDAAKPSVKGFMARPEEWQKLMPVINTELLENG